MKLVKYSEFSIDDTYLNKETQFSTNNSYDDLDEETYEKYGIGDFWQDVKYGISKLGRYKKIIFEISCHKSCSYSYS